MCGIAGILKTDGSAIDPQLLRRFSEVLQHRGPDDLGFLSWSGAGSPRLSPAPEPKDAKLAMVHRRLSILDLSAAGHQPMTAAGGEFSIAYNGEIYNYLELRKELERLGHTFHSHSDTEVLLAGYIQWGKGVLTRLTGMFAFAVLDCRKKTLFLARDFFGIKPLYYTSWQGGFAFASEIKALLEIPAVSRRVNPQRVYDYLRFEFSDFGGETMFAQIRQMPPAHYSEHPLHGTRPAEPRRYWQIELKAPLSISLDKAAARVRELFLENVRLHLRSDVPVGAALSGGIDSSSIVMAMRWLQGRDLEIHTFSYIADEAAINEERWVDLVGEAAQSAVHKVWKADPRELLADLDSFITTQDEPLAGTSPYAQFCVFRLAREKGIKVMLDGQGADELLGGYIHYLPYRLASLLRRGRWREARDLLDRICLAQGSPGWRVLLRAADLLVPYGLKEGLFHLLRKRTVPGWLDTAWLEREGVAHDLLWPRKINREFFRHHLLDSFSALGLPALLRYEDRNSMAFSIESRVPFLSPALAAFLFSLPEDHLIAPDGTSKAVFRKALRGIVPDPILDRRDKIGFATPELHWLAQMRDIVEDWLGGDTARQIPLLDQKTALEDWLGILEGKRPFDFRVWRWLNLIRWSEIYNVVY